MKDKAIYPGSFNPIHNLHIEIIKEASKYYEKLYVLVANNESKSYPILISERYKIVKKAVESLKLINVEVIKQEGNFVPLIAKKLEVNVIVRGLKGKDTLSVYESYLADQYLEMNDNLSFSYITVAGNELSSTIIRKRIKEGKDISSLVPKEVIEDIFYKYEKI